MIDINSYRREIRGLKGSSMLLLLVGALLVNNEASELLSVFKELCWSAVDMLFVLSGFLISLSLLKNKHKVDYYYSYFRNKFFRVVILYYFFIVLYQFILPPLSKGIAGMPDPFLASPLWYWGFISNLKIFLNRQWNDEVLTLSWSLAIGVQFFMLWPFLVKTFKSSTLKWICLLYFTLSVILRLVFLLYAFSDVQVHTFTLCRLDAISLGCLLALDNYSDNKLSYIMNTNRRLIIASVLSFYILDFLVYSYETSEYLEIITASLFYSVNAISCLFILISSLSPRTNYLRSFLQTRPMNYLGMISYPLFFCIAFIPESIIQFGFPYMFLDEGLPAELIYCLSSIVLSLALASLIYFTISKPLQALEANK